MITGFCGRVYSAAKDHELGYAVTRAYNDWMYDEWWQQYPERFIPLGITYLADNELAAAEIYRNAERGFVAVSLSERPHKVGFPGIFDEYWDPVMRACEEYLWSGWTNRYPGLNIAMSEGGIGWVAMLLDRLDNIVDRSGYVDGGYGPDNRPGETLKRNFWFCTIDDPSTIDTRYRIGVENIMVETDYPHGDGTWPHTQDLIADVWGHIPTDELRL